MKETNTKENGFEKLITDYLVVENGYILRTSQNYDNVRLCRYRFIVSVFRRNTAQSHRKTKTLS